MKLAAAILALLMACGIGACSTTPVKPQHKGAICLESSKSVILIPTMCGPHDVCEIPIVADICERIERDISIKP